LKRCNGAILHRQIRLVSLDCDNLQYYCTNAVMWPGIQT
jgi:hypothetical protein